jgi:hypothetical protein
MEIADEDDDVPGLIDEDDNDDLFAPLPGDFALAGTMGNEPKMLEEAL